MKYINWEIKINKIINKYKIVSFKMYIIGGKGKVGIEKRYW